MTMKILLAVAAPAWFAATQESGAQTASSDFLPTAEAISTIALTVAVLGVLVALLAVLLQLRRLVRSVSAVAKRMEKEAAPVMDRARSVAENVDFITMAIRTDVQKLNASVSSLNDRLKDASVQMEERIQDFTALVEVLQNEAEDLALDTAAAVRGVRAGTRSLAADGQEGPYSFPQSTGAGEAED
ncbi:MAG: hypothetical protein HKO65_04235 [Gemmatimonadetes bacterium]|nr:hypothetical protein [Gemmatimonadota bacterium]